MDPRPEGSSGELEASGPAGAGYVARLSRRSIYPFGPPNPNPPARVYSDSLYPRPCSPAHGRTLLGRFRHRMGPASATPASLTRARTCLIPPFDPSLIPALLVFDRVCCIRPGSSPSSLSSSIVVSLYHLAISVLDSISPRFVLTYLPTRLPFVIPRLIWIRSLWNLPVPSRLR